MIKQATQLLSKLLFLVTLLSMSNTSIAQAQQYRIQNPYNPAQSFLYTVSFTGDAANVTRQTVSWQTTDSIGLYVIGIGWSYDDVSGEITFPNNPGKEWFGVDYEFTEDFPVIMGGGSGVSTVRCSCATGDAKCDVRRVGNCFSCYPGAEELCFICGAPELGNSSSNGFFPFVINASNITFEIIGDVKTYVFRKINPNNSTESYVYNINVEEDSNVNLTRTTVPRLESDKNRTFVLGYENFSLTDSLHLLAYSDFDWHAVDTNFSGDVSVIAGGHTVTVDCPCKKKETGCSTTGSCSAAMMGSCISCEVETCCNKCDEPVYSGIVTNPINAGVFICAKSVSFVLN